MTRKKEESEALRRLKIHDPMSFRVLKRLMKQRSDPAPRIKPLEWSEKSYFNKQSDAVPEDDGHGWMIHATNPVCGFNINYFIPKKAAPVYRCETFAGGKLFAGCIYEGPSLEEAKAAAETEHRKRVMSALMEE